MSDSPLHLVMYTSVAAPRYRESDEQFDDLLNTICEKAQTTNPSFDVSGVLLVEGHRFIQILEGEKDVLLALVERISADPRHEQFEMMIDEPIKKKSFADWNMELFIIEKDFALEEKDIVNFRDIYLNNFKPQAQSLYLWIQRMILQPQKRL